MAAFTKANDWVEYDGEGANLGSDQFIVALTNTAPASETSNPLADGNGVLANLTQITYTNLSSRNLTTIAATQTAGTYKLDFSDLVLTASGGDVGPFRYIYIYDSTVAGSPIVGVYDLVTPVTITDGSSKTLQFHANGFLNKT